MNYFFSVIDFMNIALENKDYQKAMDIYKNYIENECYSISKYNFLEAKMSIEHDTYFRNMKINNILWDETEEVKKIVSNYSVTYFDIVEAWIWNYMIKNNLKVVEQNIINNEIVNWLLTKKEFKKICKFSTDKRIVSKILFQIDLNLDKKSKRISYC